MHVVAEAPAKLLLFGEHAAVYGYPAIGIPLPWKMKVSLKSAARYGWDQDHSPLQPNQRIKLDRLLALLPHFFPELGALPPFELSLSSTIPIGVGFGSSGALSVALVRALYLYLQRPPSEQEVWQQAHQLEKIFHAHPSGIDTGIATFEKPCYFEGIGLDLPSCKLLETFDLPLVIAALERRKDTGELVAGLAKRRANQPLVETHLSALGQIASTSKEALLSEHLAQVGKLALMAHHHLGALELSTSQLDLLVQKGMEWGALGGKLSGSGGGGAFFLVANSQQEAQTLAERLNAYIKESGIIAPVESYSLDIQIPPFAAQNKAT